MKYIIIGAGPAGMAAGHTLSRLGKDVHVFEKDSQPGGIAKTVAREGFRFDIGGHRFFTCDRETDCFVRSLMKDELLDVRRRSKIYLNSRFLNYPLTPSDAFCSVGFLRGARIIKDYACAKLFSRIFNRSDDVSLRDWVVRRFGRELYKIYFEPYNKKLWGIGGEDISADWAAERISGMSLGKVIFNSVFKSCSPPKSLASNFYYPKLGIGRISERLCEEMLKQGGRVSLNSRVVAVRNGDNRRILGLDIQNGSGIEHVRGDCFISSMPVTEFISSLDPAPPRYVRDACAILRFRDIITVNLIINRQSITGNTWIYFPELKIPFGRMHEPKNWSSLMVKGAGMSSLVVEYFCSKGDSVWMMPDQELINMTVEYLSGPLGFINKQEAVDGFVLRVEKAYCLYKVGYAAPRQAVLDYLGGFKNFKTIGRAGTFSYNNMDHSLAMGIAAAKYFGEL